MLLDTVLAQGQRRNWRKWLLYYAGRLTKPGVLTSMLRRFVGRLSRRVGYPTQGLHTKPSAETETDIAVRQIAAFRRAARWWRPDRKVVDFRVVLFRATDKSRWAPYVDLQDDCGWGNFLGEQLCMVDVPGTHRSMIELPNVAELGRRVKEFLGDPDPAT